LTFQDYFRDYEDIIQWQ